jgi:hypothetical protein
MAAMVVQDCGGARSYRSRRKSTSAADARQLAVTRHDDDGGQGASVITDSDIAFFEIFGYLHIPGYFADEIGWITAEFEAAWAALPGVVHDGSQRTIYPGVFVGATPRLAALIEHPKVAAICRGLLGEGYGFHGGDGNFYSGDTGWHSDAFAQWPEKTTARHLKIAFYLDPLTRDDGALRVMPGSHHEGDRYCELLQREAPPWMSDRRLKVDGRDLPAAAIESRPGDLVCFDHRTKHAAFGGGGRRRMFAMNWIEGALTPAKREAILAIYRFYRDHERLDWRQIRGDWYDRPPREREPLLREMKEFGEQVMSEGVAAR